MDIQAMNSLQANGLTGLTSGQVNRPPRQKPAGPPPAAAGGTAPSGAAGETAPAALETSSSTNSSANVTLLYDKRDSNQDSSVSAQEAMAYSRSHLAEAVTAAPSQAAPAPAAAPSSVPASQLQAGLNAYQQNQQVNSTTTNILRSSI